MQKTELYDLHVEAGGKMVSFAGYSMPLHYQRGIIQEHLHTREQAGLFDVSHMGQAQLIGGDPGALMETLVPAAITSLEPGRQRCTVLLNERGGIVDDTIIARPFGEPSGRLLIVFNASRKQVDHDYIASHLNGGSRIETFPEKSLLALQGPAASTVLERLFGDEVTAQVFMSQRFYEFNGERISVARCGYTGEDGYEISVASKQAVALAKRLLAENEVELVGLGARDSLRMECGLCLYGSDIDENTTPVEANLSWMIPKARRETGGFAGADAILRQLAEGAPKKRVGVRPEGRMIARAGVTVHAGSDTAIGEVTSGCFGPTVQGPIAIAYVDTRYAAADTPIELKIRGRLHPAQVVALPFVPTRYYRGVKT